MRIRTTVLGLALALAAGTAAAHDHAATALSPNDPKAKEIASLFDRWNAALATGNPKTVAALYAPNGVLQPTVSNEVRVGPAAIERYFVDFLKARPQGVIDFREIRMLDADTALDAGVYTFTLTKDGKPVKVQARYTYLYEMVGGEWKIMNHHSSAMPEPVPASIANK